MAKGQEHLRQRLLELGFDEVRFVGLSPGVGQVGLGDWLKAGYQADMDWMERTAEKRLDPNLVLPGARSAILIGVTYHDPEVAQPAGEAKPAWARYALHQDYHDTIKPALVAAGKALEEVLGAAPTDYRYYVDTGPVLERAWAARAGMGFVGKNAMLISRRHGNWLLLSCILCREELQGDAPVLPRAAPESVGLLCGKCTRCMDACPTQAFPAPGVLDSRRCISYQTIENKGMIPASLREAIGLRVYGCDTCLEVCPWNRFARQGRRLILSSRRDIAELTLEELLELTAERFAKVFKGTAVKRIKLVGILRNACIAAGNSGEQRYRGHVLRLAAHSSPVVRAHAVWAARKLGATEELAACRSAESDERVLAEY